MASENPSSLSAPAEGATNYIEAGDRLALVRASVCADSLTTTYLRGGTGPLVVVLGSPIHDAATNPLIGLIADHHRVVIPDLQSVSSGDSPTPIDFSAWLGAFLDGLGADDVVLVASDDLAPAAVAFARSDSDRVRRVVLSNRVDTHDDDRARCVDVTTLSLCGDPTDADQLRRPRTGGGCGR